MITFARTIFQPRRAVFLRKQGPGVACAPRAGGEGARVPPLRQAAWGFARTGKNTCCSRDWKSSPRGLRWFQVCTLVRRAGCDLVSGEERSLGYARILLPGRWEHE